jgi:hypothetical protein
MDMFPFTFVIFLSCNFVALDPSFATIAGENAQSALMAPLGSTLNFIEQSSKGVAELLGLLTV